jgi:hypothetical protein
MRVRREEVRRQNEFFERLLADAVPTVSFDDRTMFISTSRSSQFLEQDAIGLFSTIIINKRKI